MSPQFQALNCWKQILTHVGVGMGAASFWRGAWYILDDQMFPEHPHWSALSCLGLGTAGMAASQGIVSRAMAVQRPVLKPVARFGALYIIGMSCVLVWRGTWVGWDCVYEHYHNEFMANQQQQKKQQMAALHADDDETTTTTTTLGAGSLMATSSSALDHSPAHAVVKSTDPGHLTVSGLASHTFAIVALGACGVFASVLAPPAAVSVIKDLAVQGSRNAAKARTGTTTAYLKKDKQKQLKSSTSRWSDDINNKAFEFIPHMASYLTRSSNSSSIAKPLSNTTGSTTSAGRNMSTQSKTSTTVITKKNRSRLQ